MVGFYRHLADECLDAAEGSVDPGTRDEWLRLANKWTLLALRAQLLLAPVPLADRDTA